MLILFESSPDTRKCTRKPPISDALALSKHSYFTFFAAIDRDRDDFPSVQAKVSVPSEKDSNTSALSPPTSFHFSAHSFRRLLNALGCTETTPLHRPARISTPEAMNGVSIIRTLPSFRSRVSGATLPLAPAGARPSFCPY